MKSLRTVGSALVHQNIADTEVLELPIGIDDALHYLTYFSFDRLRFFVLNFELYDDVVGRNDLHDHVVYVDAFLAIFCSLLECVVVMIGSVGPKPAAPHDAGVDINVFQGLHRYYRNHLWLLRFLTGYLSLTSFPGLTSEHAPR